MHSRTVYAGVLSAVITAPGLAQSPARTTRNSELPPTLSVAPNTLISARFPKLSHYETWTASDPVHPGRLLACSIVQHEETAARSVHCYASLDNGKTWPGVLELDASVAPHIGQPAGEYGRGDTAFVVTTVAPFRRGETHIPSTKDVPFPTLNEWGVEGMKRTIGVMRSVDAGMHWEKVNAFPFIDRPTIAVDKTTGKFAGRLYVAGSLAVSGYSDGPSSQYLYRSLDGGKTFLGPAQRIPADGGSYSGASNSVILSDGTLAFLITHGKARQEASSGSSQPQVGGGPAANAQLQLLTSTDGGESLDPEILVAEWYSRDGGADGPKQLAVDPGSRYFKDRLYAVWTDASSGRNIVRFAYSADKGRTWSDPITVNDDRPPADPSAGPDHSLPTVAVNKDGAVLVAWYDRREIPDRIGWRVYGAASLDGGVTFTPNAPISEKANVYSAQTAWIVGGPNVSGGGTRKPGIDQAGRPMVVERHGRPLTVTLDLGSFFVNGGGNFGIAATPDGVFHPTWIDNRNGVGQLWTSSITVNGAIEKNGIADLADYDDITDKLTLEAESVGYDRTTNTLTLAAKLKNTSRDVIRGPIKVRVIALKSQLGIPVIVDAENEQSGANAIWDFTSTIPETGLAPDSVGRQRSLTFRLTDVRPIRLLREPPGFTSRLVNFDARVYSRKGNGRPGAP